jgi:ribosomal protein S15
MKPKGRKKKKKVHRYTDPYRAAQARQRKAANIARQQVLQREREEAMGDPVRSRPTPFVASLSSRQPSATLIQNHLNYYLQPTNLHKSLEYSKWLTEPLPPENAATIDPEAEQEKKQRHEAAHANAEMALTAITSLENGSSADRKRINIQRCIEEFGRHHTDSILPPKTTSIQHSTKAPEADDSHFISDASEAALTIPDRVGRDTGSPEVQAAVLTAKITTLAENLHNKDKHNKRNLRVLVHKRQKMLNYLRRKERGGPRWQNLVEKLGVNDAMWKGEISL